MPKLKLLTSKETQLNALPFVREAASLSYKTLQEYNDIMIQIVEDIISTARGALSFTHAENNNTTINPHVNGSTYFR